MSRPAIESSLFSMSQTEFRLFRDLIHRHTGIWLQGHKQLMLASRLARRLRHHQLTSFAQYYQLIEGGQFGSLELGELINCVTTNKTSFFRERHHFEFLAATAIEEILSARCAAQNTAASRSGQRFIRVWSAACSTGEEPYSIAITLLEKQATSPLHARSGWNFQVLASDIDTQVLAAAMRGIYPAAVLADVDPACRSRYFLRGKDDMNGYVRIKKPVADMVEFQRINLMDTMWPVTGKLDVVFFRNALIYFQRETQDLFLRRIIRHMRPGGYLFLGHSEHIPWMHDILEPQNNTVYRVRGPRP